MNIEIFNITYFDGEEWAEEWPEDIQALPDLAEITIAAKQTGNGVPPMELVTVNFVRNQGGEAGAMQAAGQSQQAQGQGGGQSGGGQSGDGGQSGGGQSGNSGGAQQGGGR